jgi:hypothetical protein
MFEQTNIVLDKIHVVICEDRRHMEFPAPFSQNHSLGVLRECFEKHKRKNAFPNA